MAPDLCITERSHEQSAAQVRPRLGKVSAEAEGVQLNHGFMGCEVVGVYFWAPGFFLAGKLACRPYLIVLTDTYPPLGLPPYPHLIRLWANPELVMRVPTLLSVLFLFVLSFSKWLT